MKGPAYVAILAVVIGTVCAQDENLLSVKLTPNKTKSVQIGGDLNVACDVNRSLSKLTHSFHVDFVMKSLDEEVILFKTPNEIVLKAANFNVNLGQVKGNGIQLNLTTRNVTDHFDGRLICRVKTTPESGGQIKEDYLDIVILRPIDALRLQLDDDEPITESKTDPVCVDVDSVNHTVACIAEGSNPAATITLNLDGAKVLNISTDKERMELNETKIKTTVTASVDIKGLQPGLKLKCTAESQFGDSSSLELPIRICQFEPKINCTVPEALEGQKDIVFSCTVDYTNLTITSFTYSLGGKEYNSECDHNDKFNQVSKKQLGGTKVRVDFKLKENKVWHCKIFYMVVVHRNGHISRQSVRLPKIADNGANFCAALAPILMLPSVWWLF